MSQYAIGGILLASGGVAQNCCCGTPVTPGGTGTCCNLGVPVDLYFYGWFALNGSFGMCWPLYAADTVSGDIYVTFGQYSANPIPWNNGPDATLSGSIGCASLTSIARCVTNALTFTFNPPPPHWIETFRFQLDQVYDFGGGVTFHVSTDTGSCTEHDPPVLQPGGPSGFPIDVYDCRCPPPGLGCQRPQGTGLWGGVFVSLTPITDILTPDGTVVPLTIDFNITLKDAGGTPILYTCPLQFSPAWNMQPIIGGAADCYCWNGWLADCTGHKTVVTVWYGSDLQWHVFANQNVASGGRDVYDGVGFPNAGNSITDWADCGGGANPTPMWSVTF